jgi:hypothetical protein
MRARRPGTEAPACRPAGGGLLPFETEGSNTQTAIRRRSEAEVRRSFALCHPKSRSAIVLALVTAFLYALSNVLELTEAEQVPDEYALRVGLMTRLVRRPRWLLGLLSDVFGYISQLHEILTSVSSRKMTGTSRWSWR